MLSAAYGAASAWRRGWYARDPLRRHQLQQPVVSVGNLGVGGSGKTPVVVRVAELLMAAGERVSVLSRGYGGSFAGDALVVSDGTSVLASSALAGDEPVMLALALPGAVVAIGPRRDVVGRAVEARFGRRVHVLDDGFQHLRLERDLDLVCLDVRDLEDQPLPAGRLRESPPALARADCILLTRLEAASEQELNALEARLGPARTFRVERRAIGWRTLGGHAAQPPGPAFLLAGIARPERFEHDVAAAGVPVAGRAFFRDHHRFRADELRSVEKQARAAGATALATTAKDAARLDYLPPLEMPVVVLHVGAHVRDETRLRERLLSAVQKAA